MVKLHKAFTLSPYAVLNKKNQRVPVKDAMVQLAQDIRDVSDCAEWNITHELRRFARDSSFSSPNTIGQYFGIDIPNGVIDQWVSGKSRFKALVADRAVRETLSWNERISAYTGESGKYISQGWKRTALPTKPQQLAPKMSLSAVNKQYAQLNVAKDRVELKLVIGGQWYTLYFPPVDRQRFGHDCKITLPDLHVDENGRVVFTFSAQYEYIYSPLSDQYVVSVDVGISNYATVSVIDIDNSSIVYSTTLSQRVHSLYNKVRKANVQVRSLQQQGRKEEAALHRSANSRRKKELAIIAAQEIAHLAYGYQTLTLVEDLSWINNTMSHGRWNRGELVKWLKHFVELNGSRVMAANAYNTSKVCYCHEEQLSFIDWHTVVCPIDGTLMDRDVNATGNIALKATTTVKKSAKTRQSARKFTHKQRRRSKNGTGQPLKYPGRDRTKNRPTPQRLSKGVKKFNSSLKTLGSARHIEDDRMVALDRLTQRSAMIITDNQIIHKSMKTLAFYKE